VGTPGKTHFGFEEVEERHKASRVGAVFDSVAGNYDLMNDLMSVGVHRIWKSFAVASSGVRPGDRVLDVAAGSCDMVERFADRVGTRGAVVATDINQAMLRRGRARMTDLGRVGNLGYVVSDAEALGFSDNLFDCVSISFGLRNVTRIPDALSSMYRVLKAGGRVVILEFSQPSSKVLANLYDAYSFSVIPWLGELVANDRASYQYLVESIRRHPNQARLKAMMESAGFESVRYHNLSGGVVAVHLGYKY
jgi:demethylmenaquinone methyltransferase/2-methoxy-6-polyprenyl-1,4-benzoquinol methylase